MPLAASSTMFRLIAQALVMLSFQKLETSNTDSGTETSTALSGQITVRSANSTKRESGIGGSQAVKVARIAPDSAIAETKRRIYFPSKWNIWGTDLPHPRCFDSFFIVLVDLGNQLQSGGLELSR